MSDPSLPWGWLARPPTQAETMHQHARLQAVIDRGWSSGVIEWYRAQDGVRVVHARLRALLDQVGRAQTAEEMRAAAQCYGEHYLDLVLAMASAGDRRQLIPVDLWPRIPERYTHTEVTSLMFQLFSNTMREKMGLFTEGRLLVNRHYALLVAHLVVRPDPITQAAELSVPYPWPFVIRLDQERTPELNRQRDITDELKDLADRIEEALQPSPKQAGRAAYGAQSEKWGRLQRARYNGGAKAYALTERYKMAAIPASLEFKENKDELEAGGVEVPTQDRYSPDSVRKWVSHLIQEFRKKHPELPPPRRGRPRRH